MRKWLPVSLFVMAFFALAGTTLYFRPSWGLMDDSQLLNMVRQCWESPRHLGILFDVVFSDAMPRPFHIGWVALFYSIFHAWPTGFYVFLIFWNMTAMIVWGVVFFHLFAVRREDYHRTVFFYPLTFFIFTPFWNIFNYLSLQEKFIVFLAPFAIYFFQKLYREFNRRDLVLMLMFIAAGIFSKATFIFIPLIFTAYAVLDFVLFRYRPQLSALLFCINGVIFAVYAAYTVNVQLKAEYTAKYRANLGLTQLWDRLMQAPVSMKCMLAAGLIGLAAVVIYSWRAKKPEFSLSALIYLGLAAYVCLLLPWGSQSYLLSATGPLVMGALFPVYDWFNRRGGIVRILMNAAVMSLIVLFFWGNIVPSIARSGDIARAVEFLKSYRAGTTAQDVYLMPPPYSESAYAVGNFSRKNVVFSQDGIITPERLSSTGHTYIMFNDLFPSVELSGVSVAEEVFSNPSWKMFRLRLDRGHTERLSIPFEKNALQRLKIKVRNWY